MPHYAVLGATGNTGQALMQVLLHSPGNKINAYCRSKPKLLRRCPAVGDQAPDRIRVFEGSLTDVSLLVDCIRDVSTVFMVVAVVDNMPGCTIARDSVGVTIAALDRLRREAAATGSFRPPRIVVLSSASLEDEFCTDVPMFVHRILSTAVSYLYKDLAEAETLLRAQDSWLPSVVFVKPGGLVHDRQGGHEISTTTAKTPLSYLDLAAAMIEIADEPSSQYDMKNVSVLPTSDKVAFPWDGIYFVITGLLYHFFPWTYGYFGEYRKQ